MLRKNQLAHQRERVHDRKKKMAANIRTGHYTLQEMVEDLAYWKVYPCWVHCFPIVLM